MRDLDLKDPAVVEHNNSLMLKIKHEKLASAEYTILEYLDNPDNKMITNRVASGLSGIRSENSMKNVLLRLKGRGLIKQVHGRSGLSSAWEKVKTNGRKASHK